MKPRLIQCRTLPAFAIAALVALSSITQSVQAQNTVNDCRAELSAGVSVTPLKAKIGDTITITAVNASVPVVGVCTVGEVSGYIVKPNLNSQLVFNNGFIPVGACFQCPVFATCTALGGTGSCQPFSATYVVAAADIGKPISGSFADPAGGTQNLSRSAVPFHVQFMPAAVGRVPAGGNSSGLIAAGNGQATVRIITPCITITKTCVTTCPVGSSGNSRYGQPIQFSGTVCNTGNNGQPDATGNHDLVNISVTDSPAATITFAANTSFNTPYNGSLKPGECVSYTGSYSPAGNLCGPFTDTISVTATDSTGATISNLDPCWTTADGITYTSSGPRPPVTATCTVCTAPCIDVVKECLTPVVQQGQPVLYRIRVQNCGDVPLQNVVLRDDSFTPGNTADDVTINVPGQLAPGAFFPGPTASVWITNQIIASANLCALGITRITNTVVATGQNLCPPPQTQTVTDTARCDIPVVCTPRIEVYKQVVCVAPGGTCQPFNADLNTQKTASGVKDGGVCPAFCYKITVVNTSDPGIEIRNLVVTDDSVPDPNLNLSGCNFPTTLAQGATFSCIVPGVTHCQDTRNVVVANGTGFTTNGISVGPVTDQDTNNVLVLNINITCESTLFSSMDMTNGNNSDTDCILELPDGFNGPVTYTLKLCNTGTSPMDVTTITGLPALVDCVDQVTPIPVPLPFTLAAGECRTIQGCIMVACPANIGIAVSATGQANDNNGTLCVYNSSGQRITDTTSPNDCVCRITCSTPTTCRVTGGGVLIPGFVDQSCIEVPTTIFPFTSPNGLTIKKITHGGQLGAPFSQMDCGAVLGNPCIRGQWSHIRHYEGNANPRDVIDMDFHSTTPKGVYDSLFCACLGCCDPETGAFIPPTLGPKVHKFQICNPDDHKVCGPMPRPAPANVIIWSGVGKVTPTDDVGGSRAAQQEWVIFRIYIEDRSEPGGGHPGGAVEPADIYCFQAWKTGIKTSKKPDFNTISPAFRTALGQANCDFVNALESGALPIGSLPNPTVQGVTADIQDCGPMHDGNHQIHPATGATCTATP